MKKILITGGTGFIGSHLCEKLLELEISIELFISIPFLLLCGEQQLSDIMNLII